MTQQSVTDAKKERLCSLGGGGSRSEYTAAGGNLVQVRNPTAFNTLEGKMTPGSQLAVSRQLDMEVLVCAILRRADSGALPTLSYTKGRGFPNGRLTTSGILKAGFRIQNQVL